MLFHLGEVNKNLDETIYNITFFNGNALNENTIFLYKLLYDKPKSLSNIFIQSIFDKDSPYDDYYKQIKEMIDKKIENKDIILLILAILCFIIWIILSIFFISKNLKKLQPINNQNIKHSKPKTRYIIFFIILFGVLGIFFISKYKYYSSFYGIYDS